MALTKQQKHRLKKRQEMGEEAYKAEEARKRKARREAKRSAEQQRITELTQQIKDNPVNLPSKEILKQLVNVFNAVLRSKYEVTIPNIEVLMKEKAIPSVVDLQNMTTCTKTKQAVAAARLSIKRYKNNSAKTMQTNWRAMEMIYMDMFKKDKLDCSNFDWLKDTDRVLKFIEKKQWAVGTKISKIASLSAITSVLKGFNDAYDVYNGNSTKARQSENKKAGDLELTDNEKKNIIKYSDMMALVEVQDLNPRTKALIGLYTLLPSRRVQFSQLLKLGTPPNSKNREKFNYYDPEKKTIEVNKYKTSKTFGRQILKVPTKLNKILKEYVTLGSVTQGKLLFPVTTGVNAGRAYESFSHIIASAFTEALKKYKGGKLKDKRVTVNILRHIHIIWFLRPGQSKTITNNDKTRFATSMGHSATIQSYYNRVVNEDWYKPSQVL